MIELFENKNLLFLKNIIREFTGVPLKNEATACIFTFIIPTSKCKNKSVKTSAENQKEAK